MIRGYFLFMRFLAAGSKKAERKVARRRRMKSVTRAGMDVTGVRLVS